MHPSDIAPTRNTTGRATLEYKFKSQPFFCPHLFLTFFKQTSGNALPTIFCDYLGTFRVLGKSQSVANTWIVTLCGHLKEMPEQRVNVRMRLTADLAVPSMSTGPPLGKSETRDDAGQNAGGHGRWQVAGAHRFANEFSNTKGTAYTQR